ncbi:ABC nitrate/sulfonate/bicarbonate family transporter, ATPase subunit [Rhodomicrobium vannielii ATCC 17100]|uniref:ABC nitrate/sulfonate/bicarbonate family transporter, ATPase subunit n=1 Tax=Rhodomicrobium vannielii (strain ATCC 17100 / DSM 162 / LMG 4299 / NCIMB 10020 / ATH 3.1.1) TaxID=648757 RepID=E3I6V4_RHOVT|nr:nitrate/sulfonate/bicarbonate ABC transporter ATP-binding protein [Rhodomicrobium vannielii]ADP71822.1 ABC nitrate/sulfonate/bicarbonate family transporter, ATPase subunit [Rhodomicrobium vannielii ATCC 17100]
MGVVTPRSNGRTPLVAVQNVRHFYKRGTSSNLVVLEDVNLSLYNGEIVALLGRSGSGKSTLLRIISGLLTPSEGEVSVESKRVDGPADGLAMVFQSFALFPWLTVQENVEIGLEAQGVRAEERKKRALAAIDLIGLDGFESAYPKELSGGMRQRVGLARALVVDPKVLLMDEPFSALDVLTAETLRTDLLDLWMEGRMPIKSILLVTHNIEEAVLMSDRILVFSSNPGRVIAEIKVNLPQPRNRVDPAFRAMVDDIYARMTAKPTATPARGEGIFPGTGINMSLPDVSTNTLAGLLETLAEPPFNGRADLPPLAERAQMEVDELFPAAETLQLLRFAELAEGDLKITDAGRRFVDAGVDERKAQFAQHLLAYVPLVAHIRRILEERSSRRASIIRFQDELEDNMPEDDAERTLHTVINWARYAEVLAYDGETGMISLDNPA